MATLIVGVFGNSDAAGKAVSELKNKGYTDRVSVVAKDKDGDAKVHQVKDEVAEATATGAIIGGPLGALAGLIAGAATIAVPGALLLVGGPLAVSWGVTGAAAGLLGGGLLGALTEAGFSDENARAFEDYVMGGDVVVVVSGDEDELPKIEAILNAHDAKRTMYVDEKE